MTIDLITATADTFDAFVGQTFKIKTADGNIELTLDNVKRFATSMVRDSVVEIDGVIYPPRKAFALTWEGPVEPVLEPNSYTVSNNETGDMLLFVSAFRQDSDCMLYESVFN